MKLLCSLGLILFLFAAGCGSGNAPTDEATLISAPTTAVSVVQDLVIGTGDLFFSQVSAIAVRDDGEILVAEAREPSQVYRFSATGDSIGVIGRAGEGPGEYKRAGMIRVTPDSIVVFDQFFSKMVTFEPDGTPRSTGERMSGSIFFNPIGFHDNQIVVRGSLPYSPGAENDDERQIAYGVYAAPGVLRDTSWTSPAPEALVVSTPNSMTMYTKPYGRTSMATTSGDTLFVLWTEEMTINAITLKGDTLSPFRIEYEPVSLTADERQDAAERLPEKFRALLELSDTHPVADGMVADDRGQIWIRVNLDGSDDPSTYWVLDPKERSVASATFGPRFRLYSIRDGKAYGVAATEDGEPLVVRYRIEE